MTNKRLWLVIGAALLLADTSVPTGLDSNSTHFLNGLGSWTPPSGSLVTNGDSNFAIPAQTSVAATSAAFTLARTWTLPAANAQTAGLPLTVADVVGGVSATNTLTVARAGADTIDGATTTVLSAAFGGVTLISDGTSKWTISASMQIQPFTAPTHQFVNSLSSGGVFGTAQPAVGDLQSISADNVVGNFSAGSAAPGAAAVPSCSGGSSALTYNTGTHAFGCNTITGGTATLVPPQGRLTLQSHTPIIATDQAGKSTIFYDTFVGNQVPVFNGTTDVLLTIGGNEISTVMQTSGTGVINLADNFDIWGVNVAGALTLCIATDGAGKGWSGDTGGSGTARGTGFTQLDQTTRPYITNANALAHCYNAATDEGSIAANRATYLGSERTVVGAGQTSMFVQYESGASGPAATVGFYLFNAYNRVPFTVWVNDTTATWTYNVASWRQSHGDASMQAKWIDGLQVVSPRGVFTQNLLANTAGDSALIGINLDTASNTPVVQGRYGATATGGATVTVTSQISPQSGIHSAIASEFGNATAAPTFSGGALMVLQFTAEM